MNFKLKIVLPQGAHFEAEGPQDFVFKEKENFLHLIKTTQHQKETSSAKIWGDLVKIKENLTILKLKLPDLAPAQAALLILAASREILQINPYPALLLSKSLKKSGYAKGRIDRIMSQEIKGKTVIPTGTKRNREYKLTQNGLAKAYIIAEKLTESIKR